MNTEKSFRAKIVALTLIAALFGTGLGIAIGSQSLTASNAKAETLTQMAALASTAADLDSPFKAVYAEVSQSIVGIRLSSQLQVRGGRIINNSAFVGSGVVISDDGYVVTNYHVVTAGGSTVADNIAVTHGGESYTAKYVAGDDETDIAVLKVDGLNAPAARIGNSDELTVGDWALVIGNPIDEAFANTLTVGVISGQNRDLSAASRSGSASTTSLIQTNAQINSGNSGGGLFNIRGELVGITSMKLSSSGFSGYASIEGMGLAIPINTVVRIADDLIEHGAVLYPRMGVSIQDTGSSSDEPTKDSLPAGVLVMSVEADSPAEKAGIQAFDIIMEADGQRVKASTELQSILRSHTVGEMIEVKIYRIPNLSTLTTDQDIPEGEYFTFEVEVKIID